MPLWLTLIIGIGGGLSALAVVWRQVLRPGAKLIASMDEAVPLLKTAIDVFGNNWTALQVLGDIAKEFRTDSGSSLRDVVNRLEQAANSAVTAAEIAKTKVEAVRLLAVEDRASVKELEVLVTRFMKALDIHEANGGA